MHYPHDCLEDMNSKSVGVKFMLNTVPHAPMGDLGKYFIHYYNKLASLTLKIKLAGLL